MGLHKDGVKVLWIRSRDDLRNAPGLVTGRRCWIGCWIVTNWRSTCPSCQSSWFEFFNLDESPDAAELTSTVGFKYLQYNYLISISRGPKCGRPDLSAHLRNICSEPKAIDSSTISTNQLEV